MRMFQTQIFTALKQLQCPILLKYFLRTYSRPAQAIFRKSDGTVVMIESKTGVLQGDALSRLFFSLALQPAPERLRLKEGLKLVIAYLDDIVIICRKAGRLHSPRHTHRLDRIHPAAS